MKSFILQFSFLLALCAFSLETTAQITLERSDYTRVGGGDINAWILNTATIAVPTEGENQVWDYSDIELLSPDNFARQTASHPDLPEANLSSSRIDLQLGLVPQPTIFYEVLDDDKYATIARFTDSGSASLAPLTGDANDTLTFTGDANIYNEVFHFYQFPVNYNDSYTTNPIFTSEFALTVNAFGLDHVPGYRIFYNTFTISVVGYGTLIVPNPDGSGNISVEALLQKRERMTLDSTFIGGQPAPDALLSAFGFMQGEMTINTEYYIIAKNLPMSALTVVTNTDGEVYRATMSDDVKGLTSSIYPVAENLSPVTVFPNPSTGIFQLDFEKTTAADWQLNLYNPLGQLLEQQQVHAPVGTASIAVSLPKHTTAGMYHFTIQNEDGQIVGTDKMMVKR